MKKVIMSMASIILALALMSCGLISFIESLAGFAIQEPFSENQVVTSTEPIVVLNPQTLAVELPEDIWQSVAADFTFEPELTHLMATMNADIRAEFPDNFNMDYYVFSYSGSVDEAYGKLFIPSDAISIPPEGRDVSDVVNLFIQMWEPFLSVLRGPVWFDKAESQVQAWQGKEQRIARMNFLSEAYEGAADDPQEDQDPFYNWDFIIASPIIDLEALNLIEGTYLLIACFNFKY